MYLTSPWTASEQCGIYASTLTELSSLQPVAARSRPQKRPLPDLSVCKSSSTSSTLRPERDRVRHDV